MATLAAAAGRQAVSLSRISSPKTPAQAAALIHRRGLAGAADHHGPQRINCWQDPMSPSKWKEEHFLVLCHVDFVDVGGEMDMMEETIGSSTLRLEVCNRAMTFLVIMYSAVLHMSWDQLLLFADDTTKSIVICFSDE
ncbi:hypothetical protein POTOM_059583 [Populus tomentosa]|uniref:Uncharacterized protein n=1 Tax=Populus tomentosa TaxID=118781 RepID=A0A8X7XTW8_POPTO|nr:hypothetical protein POTOM_059583 [Populus tomentosa]